VAKLIYGMITSLDGYTQDEHGSFGWGAPEDEGVHSYINELVVGRHLPLRAEDVRDDGLLGDRAHDPRPTAEAAEKIVYSRILAEPRSARTRIEREFDPDAVRRLKADTQHDITVDGPELAAQAIRSGLVDEFQMILCPVVVGGGKRFFPDGVRMNLELVEQRRFGNGVVVLRYAVRDL